MSIQKVEMTVEQKENGQYVEQVAYPFVEYDHVAMENGMDIMSMIRDDVSTPMVTHNTTSWKVGQGDSDVSESIVDSSVSDMTIKGQTYQNILPSPSLRNSMTNGKTMQKLNEGYDSVNTVDGVCKSAILSGQTKYKNIDGQFYDDLNIFQSCLKLVGKNIDSGGGIYDSGVRNTVDFVAINEDSKVKLSGLTLKNLVFYDGDKTLISVVGVNTTEEYVLNIPVGARFFRFSYDNTVDLAEASITISTLTMQSVKMPVLTTTGKNLFDATNLIFPLENIHFNNVKILDNNSFSVSVSISSWRRISHDGLKSNKTYTLSFEKETSQTTGEGTLVRVYGKKEDKSIVLLSNGTLKTTTFTGYVGFEFAVVSGANGEVNNVRVYDIQLEESPTETSYEPHKTNILSTPSDLVLRGIGTGSNRVEDKLNCLTGEVTQRIGEYQITGEENWDFVPSRRRLQIQNPTFIPNIKCGVFACDKLQAKQSNDKSLHSTNGTYYIGYTSDNWLRIILGEDLTSLEQGKEWLKANKPTIQYQLKTESIKTVDLSILDQDNQPVTQLNSFANGHIQVSSQEGTLIPTTEYEVPTSNSYHADLMKANTQYTMKNMQGTFTIDGIQYNASVNGTFTSPNTLSNRLMITNVVQTQPMLLEGDMTSKEVPYVEGIKSTFEGVDRVEVYSVGKNLFDVNKIDKSNPLITKIDSSSIQLSGSGRFDAVAVNLELEPNTTYTLGYNYNLEKGSFSPATMRTSQIEGATISNIRIFFDANTNNTEKSVQFTTTSTGKVMIRLYGCNDAQEYVTTFSNIYINKGVSVGFSPHKSNTTLFQLSNPLRSLSNGVRDEIVLDRVNHKAKFIQRVGEDLTQLDTPIITEVNLEGYPYVYKGGHIFLNTEIAPITEVTYSINQAHQIESSNEDILRHQKEINHLYELIAQYVQVQYEAELIDIALQG